MHKSFPNKMQQQTDFFNKLADDLARFQAEQERQLETVLATLDSEKQQKLRSALAAAKNCRTLDEVQALIKSIYASAD